ncbi:hypothetical protein [Paenibacillus mucilaginosus]|uniref:Uncharacterized protein n=2 Tax=Paenibacillus mucilaginosus TaxID=61624 RepID=F8F4K4_PAEMK|nr:hypothetical protein [Paenibacillus mucilaginosus]AEI39396.1 hypothetical protein KNP414_00806 [Paenibacillus mucilaginosus KNP414]MCG7214765.1 hypothetical protein [Paenibacillus mucilaginosus]WDM28378.1 hypothetical protein KCX80_03805 [Paenibacillus mucilaginosus]
MGWSRMLGDRSKKILKNGKTGSLGDKGSALGAKTKIISSTNINKVKQILTIVTLSKWLISRFSFLSDDTITSYYGRKVEGL